jgi:hypothetical protein
MSKAGIGPGDLSPASVEGGFAPMIFTIATEASVTSKTLFGQGATASVTGHAPDNLRVINWWVVMTGAGGGGDTVQLTDGSGNAISSAVDVSAAGDNDIVSGGEVYDAYSDIPKYSGDIRVVTASDALCRVYVMCQKLYNT